MVLDVIENAKNYYCFGPLYQKGFEYIFENADKFDSMKPGRYPILGDDLYALVKDYETRTVDQCELETHFEYADIHYVREGYEFIAYEDKSRCHDATCVHVQMQDVHLYEKQYNNLLFLEPGSFAIFRLNDAHMPHMRPHIQNRVKKVLIKVNVKANERAMQQAAQAEAKAAPAAK